MHVVLPFAALLLLAGAANAHDFWLQPQRFWTAPRTPMPVAILVGHAADRAPWSVESARVVLLRDIGPKGVVNRLADVRSRALAEIPALSFSDPGVHIVALQSTAALSNLPAVRFNDFLQQEGLTTALALRARTGRTTAPGRELYSRRAKALVQVGPPGAPQPHVIRPIGMTLEIVPERDPYAAGSSNLLPVRVIFEGRPLAGALVKLTNLDNDAKPAAMTRTDARGRAVFTVPRSGPWLLNVVWTKAITGDPRADFETTFSSLTFGYPTGRSRDR
jgi:uncharacterized GH25 family protein